MESAETKRGEEFLMGLGIAICKELDTLYQNFDKRENLIARDEEFSENEGKEIEQPKTFSSIAKEDDIANVFEGCWKNQAAQRKRGENAGQRNQRGRGEKCRNS